MGGGSLKWGPPLVKRDLGYRFFAVFRKEFFTISLPFKWVNGPEWVCVFVKNIVKWVIGTEWVCVFVKTKLSFLTNLSFLK